MLTLDTNFWEGMDLLESGRFEKEVGSLGVKVWRLYSQAMMNPFYDIFGTTTTNNNESEASGFGDDRGYAPEAFCGGTGNGLGPSIPPPLTSNSSSSGSTRPRNGKYTRFEQGMYSMVNSFNSMVMYKSDGATGGGGGSAGNRATNTGSSAGSDGNSTTHASASSGGGRLSSE
jgi:hypothetical protein